MTLAFLSLLVLWPIQTIAAIADFVGEYRGTFSGDDRGTWEIEIDTRGAISGSAFSTLEGIRYKVSGNVTPSGSFTAIAGSAGTGATYDGSIALNGRVSGTWISTVFDERGTFEGRRIAQVETVSVRIKARAFIPGVFVQPPGIGRCDGEVVHAGDDRIGRRGNAQFDPGSPRFRLQEIIDVVAEKRGSSVEIDVRRATPQVKRTREFAFDALADGRLDDDDLDGQLNDCRLLNRRATGSPDRLRVTSRVSSNGRVNVRFFGGARNPLIPGAGPHIDWRFDIILDFTGGQPEYTISGKHDGFPAFEVYLNDARVYQFDPGRPSNRCGIDIEPIGRLAGYCLGQVARLLPPMDQTVTERSGTIPEAR